MEKESRILSKRARKFISGAYIDGVKPEILRQQVKDTIRVSNENGEKRVTRKDFKVLK